MINVVLRIARASLRARQFCLRFQGKARALTGIRRSLLRRTATCTIRSRQKSEAGKLSAEAGQVAVYRPSMAQTADGFASDNA